MIELIIGYFLGVVTTCIVVIAQDRPNRRKRK